MPRVPQITDVSLAVYYDWLTKEIAAVREILDGKTGTQNPPGRNKPLAQGKPTRSRATGNTAKGKQSKGKGTKPKRGRETIMRLKEPKT